MTKISLNFQEVDLAINTARLRMAVSIATQLKIGAESDNRNWIKWYTDELIGACGEIAVAKLGKFFFVPGLNEFHAVPDVFRDVEVRSTANEHGMLVVRDNDVLERRFVLAIVRGSVVVLAGWIYGTEGAKSEYLANPYNKTPAWFIPIKKLRPMETFQVEP